MLSERREFHGVVLGGESFVNEKSLKRFFAANGLEFDRPLSPSNDSQVLHHARVYSDTPFVRAVATREALAVRRRGREQYQFDAYILLYPQGPLRLCLFAVPLVGLLREIVENAAEAARGDVPFQSVRLKELVAAVLAGEHMGGKLKVRAVDFEVSGDDDVKRLIFKGADTLYSKTYARTVSSLKSIVISPRSCTLTHDDHAGNRISLEADRFGNYSFHVGAQAHNLARLRILLDFLQEKNLLKLTHVVPTRRVDAEDVP